MLKFTKCSDNALNLKNQRIKVFKRTIFLVLSLKSSEKFAMASSYSDLLSSLQNSRVAEETFQLPSEIELQSLFFAGHFGRSFESLDGKKVVIRQFGEWNHGPGPDFLNCSITVDDAPSHGPIELDTQPSDWEAHGHATNPSFDEVILHLSVEPSARTTFIRTSEHREVTQVRIPRTHLDTLLPPPLLQAPVTLGRCFFPLSEMKLSRVEDLLKKAAIHRARIKAARFSCVADVHGYPQALWQALANALGYCLLYTSPSPRDLSTSRMPSSA